MAISGFMPAWMKISSTDKTNGNQKLNIDRLNNNKSQLKNELNSTILPGKYRTGFNDQKLSTDFNEQPDHSFSFLSRRSHSRERVLKSFGKDSEISTNDYSFLSSNRYLTNANPINQRRLHSVSSSSSSFNSGHVSKTTRYNIPNENSTERPSNDKSEHRYGETSSDITIKSNGNNFDRLEKDFPSLNGRDSSSNNNDHSSVWNNGSSKFRISNNYKYSQTFGSNILLTRRDRLLSTPHNLNMNPRLGIQELQTSCITQTKNLDKRSHFLNSLKNNSNKEEKNETDVSKRIENSNDDIKSIEEKLNFLSAIETSEEKELLMRMGWNDDMAYEITEKDKEEYERQSQFLPKTSNRSATLIKALHRRSLPFLNIRDVLQLEIIDSISDEDSSDE